MFAGVRTGVRRNGVRFGFLAALFVALALVAGYSTANSGYSTTDALAPAPLTKVRSASPRPGVELANLTVTSRLRPASLRATSRPAQQTQQQAQQQPQGPRQQVTP